MIVEFTTVEENNDDFDTDFESTDDEQINVDDEDDDETRIRNAEKEELKRKRNLISRDLPVPISKLPKVRKPKNVDDNDNVEVEVVEEGDGIVKRRSKGRPRLSTKPKLSIDDERRRQSKRSQTVNFRGEVKERLSEAQKRRSTTLPRSTRKIQRKFTQTEKIFEALCTEDSNISSLKMLELKETLRQKQIKKALRNKTKISGPFLRFVSRIDEGPRMILIDEIVESGDKKGVEDDNKLDANKDDNNDNFNETDVNKYIDNEYQDKDNENDRNIEINDVKEKNVNKDDKDNNVNNIPMEIDDIKIDPSLNSSIIDPSLQTLNSHNESNQLNETEKKREFEFDIKKVKKEKGKEKDKDNDKDNKSHEKALEIKKVWKQTNELEKFSRNLVILKNYQKKSINYFDLMPILFGDHVDWKNLKAIPSRFKMLTRNIPICPFTGLNSNYIDPLTGVPFYDVNSFKKLRSIIDKDLYLWSDSLNAFIAKENDDHVDGFTDLLEEINKELLIESSSNKK